MKKFLIEVFIGLISGIVCGLFSAGGGLILIPLFEKYLNLNERESRATTIFCILPMTLIMIIFYNSKKFIDWKIGFLCAIGGIMGCILGSIILNKIKPKYLKVFFSIFLLYSGIRLIIQ